MKLANLMAFSIALLLSVFLLGCSETARNKPLVEGVRLRYDSLQQIGLNLISARDSQQFIPFLDSANRLAAAEKSEFLEMRLLQLKQIYLEKFGRQEEAYAVVEQVVLATEDKPALREIQVEALYNKGNLAFQLGQYQTAFQAYFNARKLIADPDSCDLAYYDYSLGMVAYRQKNFRAALEFFQRADLNYAQCKVNYANNFRRQEIKSNIGLCYINLNQPDSAIYWYIQARNKLYHTRVKSEAEKRMHKIALAVVSGNIGVAYARQGELEKAKAAIQEEIRVNLLPGNDRGHLVYSVNELCEVLLQQQKLDEMYAYLRLLDSLPELRAANFPSYRFYHHLAQYHIRKGNNAYAVLFVDSFLQKYEVMRKEDRDLFRTDLDRSMRILESEYQLKQAKHAAEITGQRTTYFLLLLLGLVLLTGVFWYAWQVSRRSNQALTQLNREKDKMLRVVAHDLRNPIAAIYSLSELNLPEDAGSVLNEDWRLVRQASAGALDLIQEMLVATELKELHTQQGLEEVSINQLCSDTARLIQYRADEKQVKLKFIPLTADIIVKVAAERMRRAITNLLTNAIKFSTSGSTVCLQVERNEKGVLISVQDKGIGIPESYRDKIFQSFTSVRRNGTKGELAYGLGLSIVKEIVESQGGQIWYISTEGQGSTFYIQLPIVSRT